MWKPLAILALLTLAKRHLGRPEAEYAEAVQGLGKKFAEWDPSKHPRGHEGNPGEFAKKGQGLVKKAKKNPMDRVRKGRKELKKEARRLEKTPLNVDVRREVANLHAQAEEIQRLHAKVLVDEQKRNPKKRPWLNTALNNLLKASKAGDTDQMIKSLAAVAKHKSVQNNAFLARSQLQLSHDKTLEGLPNLYLLDKDAAWKNGLITSMSLGIEFVRNVVGKSPATEKLWSSLKIREMNPQPISEKGTYLAAAYHRQEHTIWVDQHSVPEQIVHEFGHVLERIPGVVAAEMEFRKRRIDAAGKKWEKADWLQADPSKIREGLSYLWSAGEGALIGGLLFGHPIVGGAVWVAKNILLRTLRQMGVIGEKLNKADFDKAFKDGGTPPEYVSKVYNGVLRRIFGMGVASEVLSMGMQRLYQNPMTFARDDPDYCKFVLDVLNGKEIQRQVEKAHGFRFRIRKLVKGYSEKFSDENDSNAGSDVSQIHASAKPSRISALERDAGGGAEAGSVRTAAPTKGPTAEGEVSGPVADAERAQTLLTAAKARGAGVLCNITRSAIKRILSQGLDREGMMLLMGAGKLYNQQELQKLADVIAQARATANLLGRSKTLLQYHHAVAHPAKFSEMDSVDLSRFAEGDHIKPLEPVKAVAYFKALVPKLGVQPNRFGPAMQRDAFTLAKATDQQVLEQVQKVIGKALETGKGLEGRMEPGRRVGAVGDIDKILEDWLTGTYSDKPIERKPMWGRVTKVRENSIDIEATSQIEEKRSGFSREFSLSVVPPAHYV